MKTSTDGEEYMTQSVSSKDGKTTFTTEGVNNKTTNSVEVIGGEDFEAKRRVRIPPFSNPSHSSEQARTSKPSAVSRIPPFSNPSHSSEQAGLRSQAVSESLPFLTPLIPEQARTSKPSAVKDFETKRRVRIPPFSNPSHPSEQARTSKPNAVSESLPFLTPLIHPNRRGLRNQAPCEDFETKRRVRIPPFSNPSHSPEQARTSKPSACPSSSAPNPSFSNPSHSSEQARTSKPSAVSESVPFLKPSHPSEQARTSKPSAAPCEDFETKRRVRIPSFSNPSHSSEQARTSKPSAVSESLPFLTRLIHPNRRGLRSQTPCEDFEAKRRVRIPPFSNPSHSSEQARTSNQTPCEDFEAKRRVRIPPFSNPSHSSEQARTSKPSAVSESLPFLTRLTHYFEAKRRVRIREDFEAKRHVQGKTGHRVVVESSNDNTGRPSTVVKKVTSQSRVVM
ncbi:hypothetical protein C7M84_017532 [Penaeus vannamei]|uniref:Uncharacterized protein n=1 Tax=Penaeus vannamei TaxID=6689 RepID=A0A423SJZ1_PENVA|nr:hypothetical protein C7M84_017532 [Penaeus vannamei]